MGDEKGVVAPGTAEILGELPINPDHADASLNGKKQINETTPGKAKRNNNAISISVVSMSLAHAVAGHSRICIDSLTVAALFLATMLPTISRDLNGESNYSWVGTGYLLTSTALAPAWGSLSDIFGRKNIILISVVEFLIFTAVCGVSTSMVMLIVGRVMQGIGGGAIISMAFVVIGEIAEMGKYMGLMGALSGLAAAVGPLIGGLLNDYLNWRWGFYICLPIGAVALLGCVFGLTLPPPRGSLRDQIKRVDYLGLSLLTIAMTLLLLALSWGGVEYSWASGQVLGCIVCAIVLLAMFVWWETKAVEPIIPLELFKSWNYVAANMSLFFSGWAMYALSYFIPVYFQTVRGLSATDSGLNNMSLTWVQFWYYHFIPSIGLVLIIVGLGLLSMWEENSGTPIEVFAQILAGGGVGLIVNAGQLTAQINSPAKLIGPSSTVANFSRLLGGVIGIAVFSTLFSNILSSQLQDGLTKSAIQFQLSADQIQLYAAFLKSAYSSTRVDISSIPVDALASLNAAYIHANVQGLHWSFIVCVPIVGLGIIFAVFIRHKPLKKEAIADLTKTVDEDIEV
ncbi:hypothetical protein HDU93_008926 [Gonapodya sp. JEL0774]|nr:hypothetical protein HDU93_008926 [Gonapodya sp. JEL0774]